MHDIWTQYPKGFFVTNKDLGRRTTRQSDNLHLPGHPTNRLGQSFQYQGGAEWNWLPPALYYSRDGSVIGKRLHCVVIAFTILEENSTCSVDGIHQIALFHDSENYESVMLAVADLIQSVEMKDTEVNTVHGETFRIVYSLGGNDYKFLSMVTGINSANCKPWYACIWCNCPKDSRWITDKTWASRTTEENELLSSKSKHGSHCQG